MKRALELFDETVDILSRSVAPEEAGKRIVDWGRQKARDYVSGKIDDLVSRSRIAGALYDASFVPTVSDVLGGNVHGMTVHEVSKEALDNIEYTDMEGKKRKGVFGFGAGNDIYVPGTGAVKKMFPGIDDRTAKGIKDYIYVHEVLEPKVLPRNEDEHAEMDARIIRSLKYLSYINEDAGDAYRGAMYVHSMRSETDHFGNTVKSYLRKYLGGEEMLN